ncbi:transposase [Streptomyces pseudovenezuelae]|uniref:Transposase n=1 Tax=Streptomyces pseudovenezuelae TaxID=67350 RepID=A0ABT6LXS7_9ACTN|nr:transposase [Streptomyces pseudovenezuelae]MDH6221120.1 transposase [Streptomyces pseudovenezuelae]
MADELVALNQQIAVRDELIAARFCDHELADLIASLPVVGPLLGAEFLAAGASDMTRFGGADRLASYAGLARVPRGSGTISGNLHRPRRCRRGFQRVLHLGAYQHPQLRGVSPLLRGHTGRR